MREHLWDIFHAKDVELELIGYWYSMGHIGTYDLLISYEVAEELNRMKDETNNKGEAD